MKKIRIVVIAVMLVLLFGCINFHPISEEEMLAATEAITQDVYWTSFGHKYHLYPDCQAITNVDLKIGSVQEAIDSGHTTLCAFCAKRAGIDDPSILIEQVDGDR